MPISKESRLLSHTIVANVDMNYQRYYKIGRILKIPLFQLFELKSNKYVIVNGRTIAFGSVAGEEYLEDVLTTTYDLTDSSNYARLLHTCVNSKALGKVSLFMLTLSVRNGVGHILAKHSTQYV